MLTSSLPRLSPIDLDVEPGLADTVSAGTSERIFFHKLSAFSESIWLKSALTSSASRTRLRKTVRASRSSSREVLIFTEGGI